MVEILDVRTLVSVLRTMRHVVDGKVFYTDYTTTGFYTIVFTTDDGEMVRPSSVVSEIWRVARSVRDKLNDGYGVRFVWTYDEGPARTDAFTGKDIESSYGDPDEQEGA